MSKIITINELADRANGYFYGMATVHTSQGTGGIAASIVFNETRANDESIAFRQVNREDVRIVLNKEEIVSIEDKSTDGTIFYAITLKSGLEVKVFLFHEKRVDAQICHALYGSYNEFLKELDVMDLEKMVKKSKNAFVSISDESAVMKHEYEGLYWEENEDDDCSYNLVFFNGEKDNPSESLTITLYDDAVNDIWLMNSSDGWDGLELRLHSQPFTKVRVSLLYK